MKKNYVKPFLSSEQFTADEYIAACGSSGVVYKFYCNAGNRNSQYHVYLKGPDGVMGTADDIDWSGRNGYISPYHPCYDPHTTNGYHEAESDSDFQKGYMYKLDRNYKNTGDAIEVIVWTDNGTNTHCTTELNMKEWETAKS